MRSKINPYAKVTVSQMLESLNKAIFEGTINDEDFIFDADVAKPESKWCKKYGEFPGTVLFRIERYDEEDGGTLSIYPEKISAHLN